MTVDPRVYLKNLPRYAEEVLKIQTKEGELAPFRFNRAQRVAWALIKEDIDAGLPVRFYFLKARQLGISTLISAIGYWLASLRKHRTVLITAHEDDAASGLFLKPQVFYKASPEEMRPMLRLSNRKELHFANPDPKASAEEMGLESRIVVRTANNRNLGASMTVQCLHLSEFAKYERVLQDVKIAMSTVLQTVPRNAGTFVFLETTADGLGYAKDFWDDGANGYRKVFISWVADEAYTIPQDKRTLVWPQLEEADTSRWGNEVEIAKHVEREVLRWYPEEANELAWVEREVLCRLQWRREIITSQFGGDLALFRQEYPITPEEAFLTSGNAVFDQRKLADIRQALEIRDETNKAVGLVYEPTNYRYDKEKTDFGKARYGPLRIYAPPERQYRYVIGGDVSEGLEGGDTSVLQVLRMPDLLQVATYEDRIAPDDLGDVCFHLGRIYNWAAVMVEANGPGIATNLRLGNALFYPNLYSREELDSKTTTYQKKWGWHTNPKTKRIMITALRGALRDDWIIFRDLATVKDMSVYIRHGKGEDGPMGAVSGEHDDTVIALGLAVQMALNQGLQYLRAAPVYTAPAEDAAPPGSFEWWAKKVPTSAGSPDDFLTLNYYKSKFGVS